MGAEEALRKEPFSEGPVRGGGVRARGRGGCKFRRNPFPSVHVGGLLENIVSSPLLHRRPYGH